MKRTPSMVALRLGNIIDQARRRGHYPVDALCADVQMSTKTFYRILRGESSNLDHYFKLLRACYSLLPQRYQLVVDQQIQDLYKNTKSTVF